MSKALEEKVNWLYNQTKDLMSFEEIHPFCEEFNIWVNEQGLANSTLGTKLSKAGFFKKFKAITPLVPEENAVVVAKHDANGNVTGSEIRHYVLTVCGLSKEQWEERNKTDRVTNRLSSSEGKEIIPSEYCKKVGELLESLNIYDLAVGLIAATGRRPCEIFSTGSFKATDNPYKAIFSGQLKKRGNAVPYEIFTLFPVDYIIKQLRRLRKDSDVQKFLKEVASKYSSDESKRNDAIDGSLNRQARRAAKGLFSEEYLPVREGDEDYNNKALRAACAALIVHRDYPGSVGSKMLAFGKFLGHIEPSETPNDKELSNLVTSLGYSDYYVTEAVPYPTAPEKEKTHTVRVFEGDLEILRGLQEKFELLNQQLVVRKLIDFYENATAELLTTREELSKVKAENKQLKQELSEMKEMNENQVEVSITDEDLESKIARIVEEKFNQLVNQLQVNTEPVRQLSESVQTTAEPVQAKSKPVKNEAERLEQLQELSDTELWASKGKGTSEEKLRRCFLAITSYNDSVTEDKLAVTNQALRQLSGVNGITVGEFLKNHADEVIYHNQKHGMGNSKDPKKVETYYNKRHGQEKIEEILTDIAEMAGIPYPYKD